MIRAATTFFDRAMRRYTPDPFLLALLITITLFFMGITMTTSTPKQMVLYWGDGFWSLIPFTLQMVMILIGGYVVALAPPVSRLLSTISKSVKTQGQAVVVVTLAALTASFLNWGLGLVIGGLVCREIIKTVPTANFRLLVAAAYSGFIVWHGGLSGSIPLLIATPGNFSETYIGGLIPVSQTLFSPFNLLSVLGLFILIPFTNWAMSRSGEGENKPTSIRDEKKILKELSSHPMMPAERLENSKLLSIITGIMGVSYIGFLAFEKKFNFDLNTINFIFIFSAIILHGHPRSFINAISEAAKSVGPILLQFPFYAGIMGMMTSSKLADVISNFFIDIATPKTFSLLTFWSAGIVNLFIPSGGGQWAVQSPVVIQAAKEMGANLSMAAMAVAWGDAWTNLLQPFWALPILAIAGLTLRDIMGYCVTLLLVTGAFLSVMFMIF